VRGFYLIERSQFCNHALKAPGKTVDVEIKRILARSRVYGCAICVVTVGDLRIDRGMESRNEPSFGANAGDHV
jgi:hypothetical protein